MPIVGKEISPAVVVVNHVDVVVLDAHVVQRFQLEAVKVLSAVKNLSETDKKQFYFSNFV